MVDISGVPQVGCAQRLDQVGTSEKDDLGWHARAVGALNAAHNMVDLVVEVVEHASGRDVRRALALPGIDHQPLGSVFGRQLAHANAMARGGEALLLVRIGNDREISADDIETCAS